MAGLLSFAPFAYQYNTRGLLDSVASAIDRVDYNPAGQNLRIDLAIGVRSDFDYDERLRVRGISSIRTADGIALQDRAFDYDDISNITAITDRRSLAHRSAILSELPQPPSLAAADLDDSYAFTYDSLYRVTLAAGPAQGSHGYRFDPIGNLSLQSYQGDGRFTPPISGTFSYAENGYGPHVLTGHTSPGGTSSFTYDANGNMTDNGAGATQQWDPKDRLSAAAEDGVQHTHIYDYASKRSIHSVTKEGRTSRTFYIDDVSEFREGRLVKYLYVGSEKVARSDFSGTPGQAIVPDLFYLHDHLGSTAVAMDTEGNVRQISSYSPYGHNRFKGISGSKAIDYGFSGKELHDSPDLSYFETRFLSSGLARFTQTDTLTLNPPDDWRLSPQKWHPYSYCWGNPVTMVDKDGKNAIDSVNTAGTIAGASAHVFDFLSTITDKGTLTSKGCSLLNSGAGYLSAISDGLVVGDLASRGDYAAATREFAGMATGFAVTTKAASICTASTVPLCFKGAAVGFLVTGGVGAPVAGPTGCLVAVGSCYAAAWGAGYVAQKSVTQGVGAMQDGYNNLIDSGARMLQQIESQIKYSVGMGISPF